MQANMIVIPQAVWRYTAHAFGYKHDVPAAHILRTSRSVADFAGAKVSVL